MIQFEQIHEAIIENNSNLKNWYSKKREELPIPVYTSVDVRDSGPKVASVDANIYPAGFNNICDTDRENAPPVIEKYLKGVYGDKPKKIILVTEEHTNNAYYWQNVFSLKSMIESAGYELEVAFPREMESMTMTTANGQSLQVHGSFGNDKKDLVLGKTGLIMHKQ